MHKLRDQALRRLEPDTDLAFPKIRVPCRDTASGERYVGEDHAVEAPGDVPTGQDGPLALHVPRAEVQVADERRLESAEEELRVEDAVTIGKLQVGGRELLHELIDRPPRREIVVQILVEIGGARSGNAGPNPRGGDESEPRENLLPVVRVAHDRLRRASVRHADRELDRSGGSDQDHPEVPAVLVEDGNRLPPGAPDSGEPRSHVTRTVAFPPIRHDIFAANGRLVGAEISMVLVHEGRADQVVLGSVRAVWIGSQVERNLPDLKMDVAPFRIRKPDETPEEPRHHGFVVVEALREDVDVILDGGAGKETDPGRV